MISEMVHNNATVVSSIHPSKSLAVLYIQTIMKIPSHSSFIEPIPLYLMRFDSSSVLFFSFFSGKPEIHACDDAYISLLTSV